MEKVFKTGTGSEYYRLSDGSWIKKGSNENIFELVKKKNEGAFPRIVYVGSIDEKQNPCSFKTII